MLGTTRWLEGDSGQYDPPPRETEDDPTEEEKKIMSPIKVRSNCPILYGQFKLRGRKGVFCYSFRELGGFVIID